MTTPEHPQVPRGQLLRRVLLGLRDQARRILAHETGRWVALAGSVGLICGVAGFVLQAGTDTLGLVLLEHVCGLPPVIAAAHAPDFSAADATAPVRWPLVVVVMGAGGAAAGWLALRFAPAAKGGGTGQAVDAYHRQRAEIPASVTLTKLAASIATVGSGGSAGCEGPIALVGAGCGSWLSRRLRLSTRDRRILLLAGISGGIAAVFHAPLAAALFACEVPYRSADLEAEALIPAFIAAIVAYCVAGQLDGALCSATGWFTPYGSTMFTPPGGLGFGFADWPQLIGYGVLAVAVVAAGRLLAASARKVAKIADGSGRPPWATAGIGAAAAGALGLAVVGLGYAAPAEVRAILPASLGSGYGALHWFFHGGWSQPHWIVATAFAVIAAAKVATTALTVSSGGSGGMFGPSIAIGGCVGAAVGTAMSGWAIAPPPGAAVLLGMAGLLAATHRTPMAAMLMVAEISGSYLLLIPSMWVVGLSFLLMGSRGVIGGQVARLHDSPAHRGHLVADLFAAARVADLIATAGACATVADGDAIDRCRALLAASDQGVVPVVDGDGRLAGIIGPDDLRALGADPVLDRLVLAGDIANGAALALHAGDGLDLALRRMTAQHLGGLPVIDAERRPIAVITRGMLIDHCQRTMEGAPGERRGDTADATAEPARTGPVAP